MAYSQTDIDNLKAAIASGAKRMTLSSGTTVEYQSLGDMLRALELMEAEVAREATGESRRSVKLIRVRTSSGF